MRIGLLARADQTGLGIQSKEFYDHIPCKVLIIDSSALAPLEILKPNPDWYPGAKIYRLQPGFGMRGGIPYPVIEEFLQDIDLLFAMETAYDYNIFLCCREKKIKTILQLNYEFLDFPSHLPAPDLFAAPSKWNYDLIPDKKVFLPVPVNTKKFKHQIRERTFVHIGGRPASHDRNGTKVFLNALRYVKSEIVAEIKSQWPIAVGPSLTPNVTIRTDFGSKLNYFDNYLGGVMVIPRKYGGLCLPMQEALASSMPVITTDISPNNLWLPNEWLVTARIAGSFQCKRAVEYYEADPVKLAEKIDQFCEEDFYYSALSKAIDIKEAISWDSLLPLYYKTFYEL